MLAINYNAKEKAFLQLIRIGTFLTFIAINLKFIVADIIKPLILFDILQLGGHHNSTNIFIKFVNGHHFEFHTPSFPDMCGDIVAIILFAASYLFMNSTSVKDKIGDIAFGYCDSENAAKNSIMKIRDCILWGKNIFYLAAVGFLFYFFSKYILTPCLEVFFLEEAEAGSLFISLKIFNSVIRLFADLILVYTYCKYIGAGKHFQPIFYSFFIIRDLLFTNLLGFSHKFDLEMAAPVLDIMFPVLLIYAIISYISKDKSEKPYEMRHIA
ncbi:MAG: hypothetical protein E3K37_18220 [Candidatus Kuenenia sp.]|nr:hypothetical protein [Candidatus Kuenenia hertensis]